MSFDDKSPAGLTKTIVIKPTMKCNLRCGYCYEFLKNDADVCKSDMSLERLKEIVLRTVDLFPNSHILWMFHGGEPLTKSAKYFEEFANFIRELNETRSLDHKIALQTNATLLTSEYLDVFEKNADLLSERIISISVDGPEAINDQTRRLPNGKGTYVKIAEALERVKKSSLSFSTISVVGSHNVKKADEIFDYMKNIGSNLIKFIPCYNFNERGEVINFGIRPLEFAEFMREIFDLWMKDAPSRTKDSRLIIEPIASIICNLSNATVLWCEYREEKCSNFTCIYPNGETWLCDTFDHETAKNAAHLKNVFSASDEDFKQILSAPQNVCGYDAFYEKTTRGCKGCDIYEYCKGGCIALRDEMMRKSPALFKEHCAAKKLLINHVKRAVDSAMTQI